MYSHCGSRLSRPIRYPASTINRMLFSSMIFSSTQPYLSAWNCSSILADFIAVYVVVSPSITRQAAIVLFSHIVMVSSPMRFQLSNSTII